MSDRHDGERHHAHLFAHDTERLDQHFLDPETADLLVAAARPTDRDAVLEIGAGTGILTAAILQTHPANLIAVEVDQRCEPHLAALGRAHNELTVIMSRIQNVNQRTLNETTMIIANPPFGALESTTRLVRSLPRLQTVTLCVSRRWAGMVTASIDATSYGTPSVAIQSRFNSQIVGEIAGECFTPATRRPASVLRLTRRQQPDPCLDVLAEALLHHSGMRVKNFLRSSRLRRLLGQASHQHLLALPELRRMQQRRLTQLTSPQIAKLAVAIRGPVLLGGPGQNR